MEQVFWGGGRAQGPSLCSGDPFTRREKGAYSAYTPDQTTFLDEVVEYLVKNGIMEPRVLFYTPFTNIHDQGLIGVFGEDISKKEIELVRHISDNANVAQRSAT
jgi:hypothetical protein